MEHSEDLERKLSSLSENEQEISFKLLEYISEKQHSRTRIQQLIKSDIQEIVWRDEKE